MNNYEVTTKIITILNHIPVLQNFIDPRKNQFKFICSCIWSMFLIMIAIIELPIEIYFAKDWFGIERIIYVFQYAFHAFGYTSSVIICLYQSKVNNGLHHNYNLLILLHKLLLFKNEFVY